MAQGKDFYIPFQDGSGRIHGICWEPEETPWAVIQVAHGMIEHIGRYDEFAQAMNRAGIAVIGHDHPGHGGTAKPGELGEFAEKNGVRRVIGAMAQVARFANTSFRAFRIFFWAQHGFVFWTPFYHALWRMAGRRNFHGNRKPAGTTFVAGRNRRGSGSVAGRKKWTK